MQRNEYVCQRRNERSGDPVSYPDGLQVCALATQPQEALAQLMLEAYRGTVDDAGETLADALREVGAFWAGTSGMTPWPEHSLGLVGPQDTVVAACLVGEWQSRRVPLIAYVLTHPNWQRQGLASRLLAQVLYQLQQCQQWPVYAVITVGNRPSEALMVRADFERTSALEC